MRRFFLFLLVCSLCSASAAAKPPASKAGRSGAKTVPSVEEDVPGVVLRSNIMAIGDSRTGLEPLKKSSSTPTGSIPPRVEPIKDPTPVSVVQTNNWSEDPKDLYLDTPENRLKKVQIEGARCDEAQRPNVEANEALRAKYKAALREYAKCAEERQACLENPSAEACRAKYELFFVCQKLTPPMPPKLKDVKQCTIAPKPLTAAEEGWNKCVSALIADVQKNTVPFRIAFPDIKDDRDEVLFKPKASTDASLHFTLLVNMLEKCGHPPNEDLARAVREHFPKVINATSAPQMICRQHTERQPPVQSCVQLVGGQSMMALPVPMSSDVLAKYFALVTCGWKLVGTDGPTTPKYEMVCPKDAFPVRAGK